MIKSDKFLDQIDVVLIVLAIADGTCALLVVAMKIDRDIDGQHTDALNIGEGIHDVFQIGIVSVTHSELELLQQGGAIGDGMNGEGPGLGIFGPKVGHRAVIIIACRLIGMRYEGIGGLHIVFILGGNIVAVELGESVQIATQILTFYPVVGINFLQVLALGLTDAKVDDCAPASVGLIEHSHHIREPLLILFEDGECGVLAAIIDGKDFDTVVIL